MTLRLLRVLAPHWYDQLPAATYLRWICGSSCKLRIMTVKVLILYGHRRLPRHQQAKSVRRMLHPCGCATEAGPVYGATIYKGRSESLWREGRVAPPRKGKNVQFDRDELEEWFEIIPDQNDPFHFMLAPLDGKIENWIGDTNSFWTAKLMELGTVVRF